MYQLINVETASKEEEYRLLRDRHAHLKKQLRHGRDNDPSLIQLLHQTELKMLQSQLQLLRHSRKGIFT